MSTGPQWGGPVGNFGVICRYFFALHITFHRCGQSPAQAPLRALLPDGAIPAAPGREADSAMIGGLAAWAPLALYPPDDPRLAATLVALQATSSYQGVFFERTLVS